MIQGDLVRRLGLNEEQSRAVEDTAHDVLISAGAGTGKTRVLVARYIVALLEGGYRPGQVAAITFTNKAAAEMRSRIRHALAQLAADYPAAEEMVEEINWAPIQTIHSFCGDLLRRYPLAAEIEPGFGVLEGGESALLFAEACEDALAGALSGGEEPAGLRELFASFGRARLLDLLAQVSRGLAVWGLGPGRLETDEGRAAALDAARDALFSWWRAVLTIDRERMPAGTRAALADLAALEEEFMEAVAENGDLPDQAVLGEVRRLLGGLRAAEVREMAARGREALSAFMAAQAVARAARIRAPFLALLRQAEESYRSLKSRRNMVDFADLELLARDLLQREEISRLVRRSFPVLLVDEFQDTNPLQWSIIESLWRGPGGCRLFAVGDVKQSIYGFRGADVRVMEDLRRELEAGGGRVHTLQDNYRSRPALTGLVNLACRPLLGGEAYEPLRPRRGEDMPVCAELLLVQGTGLDRAGEAAMMATKLAGLLREGPPIADPETGLARPLVPGDVAVLLRATTHLPVYERALRLAGLPYRISAGGGFYDRREVRDLLLLLRVVEDRRDGIALAAVLRSPLFGVSEAGLFRVAGEAGLAVGFYAFDPADRQLGEDGPLLARAREIILRLIARRHLVSLDSLLEDLVAETDYRALQAAYPDYRQRLANLDKLLSLAKAYANLGRGEIGEFLAYLQSLESLSVRESEAALASGGDAVSIMTVHAAKGLEFPVVFLPDLGRGLRSDDGPILVGRDGLLGFRFGPAEDGLATPIWRALHDAKAAREEDEAKRLLYVAMTRARDYLYLIGSGARSGSSWLGWLMETLPGAGEGARVIYAQGELPVVREAPAPLPALPRETLARRHPGIARGEVVVGPREAAATAEPEALRPPARNRPILTVSGLLTFLACPRRYFLRHMLSLPEPARRGGGEGESGGGGPVLGARVHAMAAALPLRGGAASDRAPSETAESPMDGEVQRLLDNYRRSPSFGALAEAAAVWTEYEFRLALGEGSLVGAADLVWRDRAGTYALADLKTNRIAQPGGAILAEHERQVKLYALALARIFGQPPRAARLEYLWPGLSREVDLASASLARVEEEAQAAMAHIAESGGFVDYAARPGEACRWCGYRHSACLEE